jgi:hypothetical protein
MSPLLGAVDAVVMAAYFVVTVAVGARSSSRTGGGSEEYMLAGRTMGCCAVGLSTLAALYSGMTLLGSPAYSYLHGPVMVPSFLCLFFVVPITVACIPVFHGAHITTAFEYLELRYQSPALRAVGSILFLGRIVMYLGGALCEWASAPDLCLPALLTTVFRRHPRAGGGDACRHPQMVDGGGQLHVVRRLHRHRGHARRDLDGRHAVRRDDQGC